MTPLRRRLAQDAADEVNFATKKLGLGLSKIGKKVKEEFGAGGRGPGGSAAATLAYNTASAGAHARPGSDAALPPEPEGLRDLITARGHTRRLGTFVPA